MKVLLPYKCLSGYHLYESDPNAPSSIPSELAASGPVAEVVTSKARVERSESIGTDVLKKFLAPVGPSLGIGPSLVMLSSLAQPRNVCAHMKVQSEPGVQKLLIP